MFGGWERASFAVFFEANFLQHTVRDLTKFKKRRSLSDEYDGQLAPGRGGGSPYERGGDARRLA